MDIKFPPLFFTLVFVGETQRNSFSNSHMTLQCFVCYVFSPKALFLQEWNYRNHSLFLSSSPPSFCCLNVKFVSPWRTVRLRRHHVFSSPSILIFRFSLWRVIQFLWVFFVHSRQSISEWMSCVSSVSLTVSNNISNLFRTHFHVIETQEETLKPQKYFYSSNTLRTKVKVGRAMFRKRTLLEKSTFIKRRSSKKRFFLSCLRKSTEMKDETFFSPSVFLTRQSDIDCISRVPVSFHMISLRVATFFHSISIMTSIVQRERRERWW
jgi:hypothetical protein